jgi:hypothetical protein
MSDDHAQNAGKDAGAAVLDEWDYDTHPGDCCPRQEDGLWTVCCRECAGTGIFPVPWIDRPSQGDENATCVKCKATGRAAVCPIAPERTTP